MNAMHVMFIDESGDHGLSKIDPNFPVFTLCGVIMEYKHYLEMKSSINELKMQFWPSKKVILHSRDIRKCEKEFQVLLNNDVKAKFYKGLNKIISETPYHIISSVVDKPKYIKKYGKIAEDVYSISLSFILERAVFYLDNKNEQHNKFHLLIEKRGAKEDKSLSSHIQKVLSRGTYYVTPERFARYGFRVSFNDKKEDICGLQLADLLAYPISTHCMDEGRANPAFDIIKHKFYSNGNRNFGLKKYP